MLATSDLAPVARGHTDPWRHLCDWARAAPDCAQTPVPRLLRAGGESPAHVRASSCLALSLRVWGVLLKAGSTGERNKGVIPEGNSSIKMSKRLGQTQ